ncbi:MAG: hypothetical protein WC705_00400 [Candidatus Paceibacterota bacterium]|jgi:hypothetical protein
MTKKIEWLKILGLLGYVLLACIFILIFRPPYILTIIIVLVPPSIVNFLWLKNSKKRVLIFSIVTALLFGPPIELALRLANAWDVQSFFFRPLGIIPLENMLFAFLNFFWVISFYEYFIDRSKEQKISRKFKFLVGLYILLLVIVFGTFIHNPTLIAINYAVASIPILIIPSLIIYFKNPKLLKKIVIPILFFAIVFFVYEVVALIIGNWWWPGEYIYPVTIFGKIFPLDDAFIWYFLSTATLIGGYEFFVDDFN